MAAEMNVCFFLISFFEEKAVVAQSLKKITRLLWNPKVL
jgi:hypothetical protein